MKKRKYFVAIRLILGIVIVVGTLTFLLYQYEQQCESAVKENQQRITTQMGISLNAVGKEIASEEDLVSLVDEMYEASNSNYAMVSRDNTILFLKDSITTGGLRMDLSECLTQFKENDIVLTSYDFTYQGNAYVIYVVSTRMSGLYQLGIDTFYIYMILFLSVVGIGVICYIIANIVMKSRLRKELEAAKLQIQEMLIQEEELNVAATVEQDEIKENQAKVNIAQGYNLAMAEMLLEKSKDEELFPFCIMIVKLYLGDKYYTKHQMDEMRDVIKEKISSKQILCEIGKGEFCILMYQTELEEASMIKKEIASVFRSDERFEDHFIKMKLNAVDEVERDSKEVFQTLRTEVDNMLKKGSHSHAV